MARRPRGQENAHIRRDLRRRHLKPLGWTIVTDNVVYGPGVDPDDPFGDRDEAIIWNLTTAARHVGLPMDLDELERWRPSPPASRPEPEDSPRPPRSRLPSPDHDQTQDASFAAADESPSIQGWRVQPTPEAPNVTGNEPTPLTAEPSTTFAPVEQQLSEKASISQGADEREAVRRESRLVREFVAIWKRAGTR